MQLQAAKADSGGAGAPDETFHGANAGTGVGEFFDRATPSVVSESVAATAIGFNNRPVIAAYESGIAMRTWVTRLTSNGKFDHGFSDDGRTSVDLTTLGYPSGTPTVSNPIDVVVDYANRPIVLTTVGTTGGGLYFVLTRFTEIGAIDTTFGTGGSVVGTFIGTDQNLVSAMTLDQANQIIYVAGSSRPNGGGNDQAQLARYDYNGAPVATGADPTYPAVANSFYTDVEVSAAHGQDPVVVGWVTGVAGMGVSDTFDPIVNRFDRATGAYDAAYAPFSGNGRIPTYELNDGETAVGLDIDYATGDVSFAVHDFNPHDGNMATLIYRLDTNGDPIQNGFPFQSFVDTGSAYWPTATRFDGSDGIIVAGQYDVLNGSSYANFILRYGPDGEPDGSYQDQVIDWGSGHVTSDPDLVIDRAQRAVVSASNTDLTRLNRFTADRADGPSMPSKLFFDETTTGGLRSVYGMAPDARDLVSMREGGSGLSYERPVASQGGRMFFEEHNAAGETDNVLFADAGDGGNVGSASGTYFGDDLDRYHITRPTVSLGGRVMMLIEDENTPAEGKCAWMTDDYAPGDSMSAPANACNVTDAAINTFVSSFASIVDGDIWLSDTGGYNRRVLISGVNATRLEWGLDGLTLLYDDNSGPIHKLQTLTFGSYHDIAGWHQGPPYVNAPTGPLTAAQSPTPFTGFALAPEYNGSHLVAFSKPNGPDSILDMATLDGTSVVTIMHGASIRVGSWARNFSIFPPDGAFSEIEPSSVAVNELPLAPHSPEAQAKSSGGANVEKAGLLQLKLLQSPILQLKLLQSGLLQLKLLQSGLLQLKLLQSPIAGLSPLGIQSDLGGSPKVQDGLKQINLAQLQITDGPTWQERLSAAGLSDEAHQLAKEPLQRVSLYDVFRLSPQIDFPTFEQLDMTESPLGQISVLPLLLGDTRLVDIGGIDWCGVFEARGASNCGADYGVPGSANKGRSASLLSLQIAGFNLDDLPATNGRENDLRAITYDQVSLDPTRSILPNIIIGNGGVDLYKASVGSALIRSVTPDRDVVANCNEINCDGDETVYTAKSHGGLRGNASVGDLGAALRGYPLNELALGVWGDAGDDPYDQPPSALGVNSTLANGGGQGFSVNFTRMAAGEGSTVSPKIVVQLPDGYAYKAGSSSWENSETFTLNPLDEPTINGRFLSWTIPTVVNNGQYLAVHFSASPEANVTGQVIASIDDGFQSQEVGSEEVGGFDANEADDPDDAPRIYADTLYFGRLDSATDVDYFRIPVNGGIEQDAIRPGSTINVYLSQLRYDADLTLYHPVHSPRGEPLRNATSSLPDINSVPDKAASITNKGEPLIGEGEADVPLLDLPLAGMSTSRGTKAEKVVSFTWPDANGPEDTDNDDAHRYVVQISGFNGAHGPETYAVRYSITPPPSLPDGSPRSSAFNGAGSSSQGTLGADVDTLILTNPTRMAALYGAPTPEYDAALTQLATDTHGVVFPVDSVSGVRAAYAAWDAKPSDQDRANAVVREINAAVDNFVGTHQGALKSMIIVGTDEVIPMGRLQDLTQTANERSFAQELRSIAASSGGNNALLGAAIAGKILSDDPYGSFEPRKFDGEWLYVPDVALGRLVETPDQIIGQINEFHAPAETGGAAGSIKVSKTLSAGADFMTKLGQTIAATFNQAFPTGVVNESLTSSSWNRSDLQAKLGPVAPTINAINTHYSPTALQPASRLDSAHPDDPNLTAAQMIADSDFRRSLFFTMGCHSGFSISDYFGGSTTDFPQALSSESASAFIGNTGFGIGVKAFNAFSQELFDNFAALLTQYDFGTALQQAKQLYLSSGISNPYDYKVLAEATYFGIPQYKLLGATPVAPPQPKHPTLTFAGGTVHAASISLNQSGWSKDSTEDGSYYSLSSSGAGHSFEQDRPVQPSRGEDVTADSEDLRAQGAWIDQLEVEDTESGFDPVLARPQVAGNATTQSEVTPSEVIAPLRIADIAHFVGNDGKERQKLVVIPAQFASTGTNAAGKLVGNETRFSKVGVQVLYQDLGPEGPSSDQTLPNMSQGKIIHNSNGSLDFSVRVSDIDSGVAKVVALWRRNSESVFRTTVLTQGDPEADDFDPDLFTGHENYNGNDVQGFFQAANNVGLVQVFQDKGLTFKARVANEITSSYDQKPTSAPNDPTTFGGPVTVHFTETGFDDSELIGLSVDGAPERTFIGNEVRLSDPGYHSIHYRSRNVDGYAEGDIDFTIEPPVLSDAVSVSYSRTKVSGVFQGPVTVHLEESPDFTGITSSVKRGDDAAYSVDGADIDLTDSGTYVIEYETGAGTTGAITLTIQLPGADAVEVIPSNTARDGSGAFQGPVVLKLKETPVEQSITVTITKDGVVGVPGTYNDNRVPLTDPGHYNVHYKTVVGTEGDYIADVLAPPVDEHVTIAYSVTPNGDRFVTEPTTVTVSSDVPGSDVTVKVNGATVSNPVTLDQDGTYSLTYLTALGKTNNDDPVIVKVDQTDPVVNITTPANGSSYVLRQHVAADYNCLDMFLLSPNGCVGLAAPGDNIDTSTVTEGTGTRAFTVAGHDQAGRVGLGLTTYRVTYAPVGPCLGTTGHKALGQIPAGGTAEVGLLAHVRIDFRLCDANGGAVKRPDDNPAIGVPVEINANGQAIGTAQGGCPALLGLRLCVLPLPIPLLGSRDTGFSNNGDVWSFWHDTTPLSQGTHRFRIYLRDGTSMDYQIKKVPPNLNWLLK